MADVTIDGSVNSGTARGLHTSAWATADNGYYFFIDSDGKIKYAKSTDGGATWAAAVAIDANAATTLVAFDIRFDKETPGDNGTLIHCWWFDTTNDDICYRSLDTSSDTLGTQTSMTLSSAAAGRGAFVSGTKTRSGYLYVAYDIDAGVERGLHRSTDAGATWSANLSTTFVEATIDMAILFPASNTGDNNDCWALYHDASADELTLKMWDSSAAAEVESATIVAHVESGTDILGQGWFSGAVRHSDGHLIVAARDATSSNHQVFDINGTGSIVEKTAITTGIGNHGYPQVFIDQLTDHIYDAYNGKRDGSETLGSATKIYYTKSTDGGVTWSAGDTAYQEGAASANVQVWAAPSGPRFYVGWRVGTTLIGNKVNSLTFSAPGGGGGAGPLIDGGSLTRGALLRGGRLAA